MQIKLLSSFLLIAYSLSNNYSRISSQLWL